MAKGLPKNYSFSVAGKTITLTDITTVRLDKLALITDTTTNKILYNFADSTVATATVATNVITLSVLQGGEANSDKLRIDYDIESSDTSAFADTAQPVSGTITADTELPAAAALADTTANPTVPAVGSFLMGWDGSGAVWDRLKQQGLSADAQTAHAKGVLETASNGYVYNGTTWDRLRGDTTGVSVKNIASALPAGTALIGKVGIDQTTNGTTNNTTNRDVTYAKFVCDSSTLVANTMKTASLTVSGFTAVEIEITNVNGASTIYYTLDNTTPSSTNFSGVLPATPSSTTLPCSGTPTLKLISAGTPIWAATIRGV